MMPLLTTLQEWVEYQWIYGGDGNKVYVEWLYVYILTSMYIYLSLNVVSENVDIKKWINGD